MQTSPLRLAPERIGGARVKHGFKFGERNVNSGDFLTRKEVRSIPIRNRNALIDAGFIQVFPLESSGGDRFVVPAGKGLFHVVEGKRLTSEPLSREQAEALAGGKPHTAAA